MLKNGYSVRKVEEMAQMLKNGEDVNSGTKKIVAKAKLPEEYNALRSHLSNIYVMFCFTIVSCLCFVCKLLQVLTSSCRTQP